MMMSPSELGELVAYHSARHNGFSAWMLRQQNDQRKLEKSIDPHKFESMLARRGIREAEYSPILEVWANMLKRAELALCQQASDLIMTGEIEAKEFRHHIPAIRRYALDEGARQDTVLGAKPSGPRTTVDGKQVYDCVHCLDYGVVNVINTWQRAAADRIYSPIDAWIEKYNQDPSNEDLRKMLPMCALACCCDRGQEKQERHKVFQNTMTFDPEKHFLSRDYSKPEQDVYERFLQSMFGSV
tara:strand:- start:3253 stop:3978 length:726 start_codon:yes stop_codon:yes gene_type:complete